MRLVVITELPDEPPYPEAHPNITTSHQVQGYSESSDSPASLMMLTMIWNQDFSIHHQFLLAFLNLPNFFLLLLFPIFLLPTTIKILPLPYSPITYPCYHPRVCSPRHTPTTGEFRLSTLTDHPLLTRS